MMLSLQAIALASAVAPTGVEAAPEFAVHAVHSDGMVHVVARLESAPSEAAYAARLVVDGRPLVGGPVAGITSKAGIASSVVATVPESRIASAEVTVRGWVRDPIAGQAVTTRVVQLGVGGEAPLCERLSFNVDPDGETEAGEIIEDQYGPAGLTVSTESDAPGGPDAAILFDSSNPTGGDPDLATPGYGPGNNTALGNLLIIAEDVADPNGDGLVDDPDDAESGGVITFDFERPVRMCRLGLVDLDKGGIGSTIRFFDENDVEIREFELPSMGDNSFQEIEFDARGVARAEVSFVSSGAIPFIDFVPCPTQVDFEDNTFGLSLENEAGQIIVGADPPAGLPFSTDAQNLGTGPDAAVLFDTDNPTGGDLDLGQADTGLVMIVPEDLVDLNGDGLVDDPDDSAGGGILELEFRAPVILESATVLDIDTDEVASIEAYDQSGTLIDVIDLAPLGNGSVQTVEPGLEDVGSIQLRMSGSGALAGLQTCPVEEPIQ